jgi:hypothetical protein
MPNEENLKFSPLGVDTIPDEDLDTVLAELEALTRLSPLDYKPHPKQKEFHCNAAKIRLLSGGNRSGKTEAGCLEVVYHSTGIYPEWYPKHLRLPTANRGRIIVTDYKKGCGKNLEPKIDAWLPEELIVSKKKNSVTGTIEEVKVRHVSGGISTFDVMTHEQDDKQFEGWSGHWAWFDEPPPREKFVATALRGLIDFRGRCWLTLTPISEPWLYDEYVLKEDPNVFFLNVDMRDNPYLPEEEIKFTEAHLNEDEVEARLHGKFKHLSGRVYKVFDPVVHVISEKSVKIDSRWPTYFVLDPADRRPHHAIWAKVDPFGTVYITDELVFKGTILEVSKEILKRELMNKIKPLEVIRILDPNKGETPSAVSGLKLKDEFAKHAVYFLTNVNDDVATGHLAVSERLSWDKTRPLSTTNHPKLFFVKENTKECVKQILTYVWDDWSGRAKDTRSQKEKPKDINKDMPDCVRYLIMSNPNYSLDNESDPTPYRGTSRTGYH